MMYDDERKNAPEHGGRLMHIAATMVEEVRRMGDRIATREDHLSDLRHRLESSPRASYTAIEVLDMLEVLS